MENHHAEKIILELSRLVETIRESANEQRAQFKWMVQLHHIATKADIENALSKILLAISNRSGISKEDEALLNALSERTKLFAEKAEALDAKTPASPAQKT